MKLRSFAVCLLTCLGLVPAWGGILAQFRTPMGDLDVELFDQDKPITVQNFLQYVQSGFYQNMFLHRCVTNFVIQGGGILVLDRNSSALAEQFYLVPSFGQIANEFNTGRLMRNVYGTLAMAKLGDQPNSASSQWFFNLNDNSANLDVQNGGFTVFGRVIAGFNTLTNFSKLEPNGGGIVNMTNWYGKNFAVMSELPVTYQGIVPPKYSDLLYADITLLSAQVRLQVEGSREITWNSVKDRQNMVEFTAQWPPTWQVLTSVRGTGQPMSAVDGTRTDQRRFYRVRIDY